MADYENVRGRHAPGNTRTRRIRSWAIAALLSAGIALSAALGFSAWMIADPERSPPQVQIRAQTKLLLAQRTENVVPDADVGFVLPPNLNQRVQTLDFQFQRVTDAQGFVNRADIAEQVDIVFLGDSLIMAEGVGLEKGFASLIGEKLVDKTVLNLGSPGAGLERQYRIFEKFAASRRPSLVVACIYVSADLSNDRQFLEWLAEPLDMTYNKFRMSYSRRNNGYERGTLLWRIGNSVIADWALSMVEPRLWDERKIDHRAVMPDGSVLFFSRDAVKFSKRAFDRSDAVFEHFNATLDDMQRAVHKAGAGLVFMLIPSKEEIFAADTVARQDSAIGVLKAELDSRDIAYLDLYPLLRDAANQHTPYFARDSHMNAYGNTVVADAFIQWDPLSQSER